MTEELSEGALQVRPSLSDSSAAAELFSCAASDFLHAIYFSRSADTEERVSQIVFGLAALFEEQSGIVELPAGFTIAGAAKRLRPFLSKRLNAMEPEDRAIFEDDAAVVTLAVNAFFEELLVRADAWLELKGGVMNEEALHEFLASSVIHDWMLGWAKRILG